MAAVKNQSGATMTADQVNAKLVAGLGLIDELLTPLIATVEDHETRLAGLEKRVTEALRILLRGVDTIAEGVDLDRQTIAQLEKRLDALAAAGKPAAPRLAFPTFWGRGKRK